MFESITAFLRGYTAEFEAPYSIETCAEMLRDQSFADTFHTQNPLLVDVNRVSDDEYTFIIKKPLLRGSGFWMNFTGQLTRTGDKTRVSAQSGFSDAVWLFQVTYILFMVIFIIGASAYSLRPDNPPANHWLILPILLGVYGLTVILPISQFCQLPHQWLSGIPEISPDKMTPSPLNLFKREFNAYSQDDIQTCQAKLDSTRKNAFYQYTPIGMLKGKTVNQTSFIAFVPDSEDKTYFWIEPDNRAMRGILSYELFGALVTEDNGTRISGFCRAKHGELVLAYLSLFVLAMVLIYPPFAFIIGTIAVLLVVAIIMGTVGQYSWYPIREIIGEAAIPRGRMGFISLRREFNFVSPYPIEDCVNMFMEYSAPTDIMTTPSGETTGNVVSEGLFIAVNPPENEQTHFWITSKRNLLTAQVEAIGSMQTEGYGTRIIGYSHSPAGWIWIMGAVGLGSFAIILFIFPAPIVAGVVMYAVMINKVDSVGSYPQRVLGLTAQRKRKLADKEGETDEP